MEAELCPFCAGEIPPGVTHDWKSCAMRVNDHRYQIRDRMMQMQADRDEARDVARRLWKRHVSSAEKAWSHEEFPAWLKAEEPAAGAGEEREER